MTPPAVLAVHLVLPGPPSGREAQIAKVTLQCGPWLIKGMGLFQKENGGHYFKGPPMRSSEDRVVLENGPERSAMLAQAVAMYCAMTEVHRAAVPPFAPAPEAPETGS